MPTETRYMRSDTHIVNGVNAFKLMPTQSDSARLYEERHYPIPSTVQWVMRYVYRCTPTQLISLGGGAVVERDAVGAGIQSNTWTPPATAFNSEDAVVIDIYTRDSINTIWRLVDRWVTEQLGAQSLDAVSWTVYYYTEIWETLEYDPILDIWVTVWYSRFRWGIDTPSEPFNSRIENFAWTSAPVAAVPARLRHLLGLGGRSRFKGRVHKGGVRF